MSAPRMAKAKAVNVILPAGFPPDTVLTREQLALALSASVDTIERAGIPASYALGSRCPRYIWRDVIAWFQHGGRAA